ncbi:hypothetical protein Ga0100231_011760 [Opitutaceae bacterium TAV4]|nr:hypothetical protein Ga0100231_011760 [Opitutaceae bacterium TAV4]
MRFHLIGNAHLDLVWLWDWREGLNESLITCRTLLRLMDEFPELTLIRGESTVYQYIQQHDPETFERIREHITTGRWDVVGGTLCQPDTNLPATETLNRHFTRGLDYMHRELGVRPRVAWSADSFGHSAGWPQIYAAAGMKYFACTRPFAADCPLPSPAFWWHGPGAERILSWRIPIRGYCTERREIAAVLDQYREQAPAWGLDNIAITYGLGNHGGGPTARHIRDILAWRDANPDIDVEFSTFHRFFAALAAEPKNHPTVQQELNFTLRGCYSSALRFKKNYRRTENLLSPAERTTTLVSAALDRPPPDLDAAWDSLLFNTFHDILPGTVIERAYDDQNAWLGVAVHDARRHELAALTALAARCDTRIAEPAPDMPSAVPVLLFNPHPYPLDTLAEVETCLEYRPIRAYKNRPDQLPVEAIGPDNQPIPFQLAPVENQFATEDPWRKRFLLPITIPPCGYQIVQVAWNETPRHAPPPPPPPIHTPVPKTTPPSPTNTSPYPQIQDNPASTSTSTAAPFSPPAASTPSPSTTPTAHGATTTANAKATTSPPSLPPGPLPKPASSKPAPSVPPSGSCSPLAPRALNSASPSPTAPDTFTSPPASSGTNAPPASNSYSPARATPPPLKSPAAKSPAPPSAKSPADAGCARTPPRPRPPRPTAAPSSSPATPSTTSTLKTKPCAPPLCDPPATPATHPPAPTKTHGARIKTSANTVSNLHSAPANSTPGASPTNSNNPSSPLPPHRTTAPLAAPVPLLRSKVKASASSPLNPRSTPMAGLSVSKTSPQRRSLRSSPGSTAATNSTRLCPSKLPPGD